MICRPHNRPTVDRHIEAIVCWMGEEPVAAGGCTRSSTRPARRGPLVEQVRYRIDVNTLHRDESARRARAQRHRPRAGCARAFPLIFDEYRRNRTTGSFILIDEATNGTVGAGMIIEAHIERPESERARRELGSKPARARRPVGAARAAWRHRVADRPARPPASRRSPRRSRSGSHGTASRAYRLDGDNLRYGLNSDLGFEPVDRAENIRRVGARRQPVRGLGHGRDRQRDQPVRGRPPAGARRSTTSGLEFLEVFVNTPLEECERRDPKGLYARAREGKIRGFTGVDAPYEVPREAGLDLRPCEHDPHELVETLIGALRERRAPGC